VTARERARHGHPGDPVEVARLQSRCHPVKAGTIADRVFGGEHSHLTVMCHTAPWLRGRAELWLCPAVQNRAPPDHGSGHSGSIAVPLEISESVTANRQRLVPVAMTSATAMILVDQTAVRMDPALAGLALIPSAAPIVISRPAVSVRDGRDSVAGPQTTS
jgi:hypothetical protein